MKEPKFSQGDWKVFAGVCSSRDIKCGGKIIATVHAYSSANHTIKECEANTKLMAAAPKMYEALIIAKNRLLEETGSYPREIEIALNEAL